MICPDAAVAHASSYGKLLENPHVAGPCLSPWKPTTRAGTTKGYSWSKTKFWDRVSNGNTDYRAGVARWTLVADLFEGKL